MINYTRESSRKHTQREEMKWKWRGIAHNPCSRDLKRCTTQVQDLRNEEKMVGSCCIVFKWSHEWVPEPVLISSREAVTKEWNVGNVPNGKEISCKRKIKSPQRVELPTSLIIYNLHDIYGIKDTDTWRVPPWYWKLETKRDLVQSDDGVT